MDRCVSVKRIFIHDAFLEGAELLRFFDMPVEQIYLSGNVCSELPRPRAIGARVFDTICLAGLSLKSRRQLDDLLALASSVKKLSLSKMRINDRVIRAIREKEVERLDLHFQASYGLSGSEVAEGVKEGTFASSRREVGEIVRRVFPNADMFNMNGDFED